MKRILLLTLLLFSLSLDATIGAKRVCPTPLYTDPVFKGAADPEIVWNEHEQEWWIFYTSRRAVCEGAPLPALAIGVASSKDWIEWKHEGYIKIDGVGGEAMGADVLWAPGIVRDGETYHMFLTFKKGDGRGERWGISESLLLHLKAPQDDLLNGWQSFGIVHVPFSSIDATILKKGDEWNIFHRDIIKGQKGVNTFRVTTPSLDLACSKWEYLGACKGDVNDMSVTGYHYQEAQFAFFWRGHYWLMTDNTSGGVPIYTSEDLETWSFVDEILTEDGSDPSQKGIVRHPGVAIVDDRAFIFYFCQPNLDKKAAKRGEPQHPEAELCYIQVSELHFKDGKITADRNAKVTPPKSLKLTTSHWGFSDGN